MDTAEQSTHYRYLGWSDFHGTLDAVLRRVSDPELITDITVNALVHQIDYGLTAAQTDRVAIWGATVANPRWGLSRQAVLFEMERIALEMRCGRYAN